MSALLEAPAVAPVVDPADLGPDDVTHIINCPPDKESSEAWLSEARVEGLTIEALCGYRWVPFRDPHKLPVCQSCVDAAGIIMVDVFGGV